MPQVSVIMPTYNRGATYLKTAVASILAQTFEDFELIIVDDASDDDTTSIVDSFKDNRIIYNKLKKNRGEYWATNFGMNLARCLYVTWVHSDDLLPKDSLKRRIELLESNSDLNFVHGDITKIDENNTELAILKASSDQSYILKQLLLSPTDRETRELIHHTTIMMKWKFFYEVGPFDCSLPYAGDIDWLIRAVRRGKFQYIHEMLYLYRSHSGSRRVTDIQNGVREDAVLNDILRRYR